MRLRSVLMFGAGYFLGTKAGRERYQEITQNLREVVSSDVTRQMVDKARSSLGLVADPEQDSTGGQAEAQQEQDQQEGSEDRPDGWEHTDGGAWVPEGSDDAQDASDQQANA